MERRIHVITLGVAELERALTFYRAPGLESPGVIGTEFVGDGTTPGDAATGSKEEVDALLARAEAAGATSTEEPHERPWGIYSG